MARSYAGWVQEEEGSPTLSVDVVHDFVVPALQKGEQVFLVVVDCLRLDHWLAIVPLIADLFNVEQHYQYSILPTATPFSTTRGARRRPTTSAPISTSRSTEPCDASIARAPRARPSGSHSA